MFLIVGTVVGSCLIRFPVPTPKGHQTSFIGIVLLLQGTISIQTCSVILVVSHVSGARLLPVV